MNCCSRLLPPRPLQLRPPAWATTTYSTHLIMRSCLSPTYRSPQRHWRDTTRSTRPRPSNVTTHCSRHSLYPTTSLSFQLSLSPRQRHHPLHPRRRRRRAILSSSPLLRRRRILHTWERGRSSTPLCLVLPALLISSPSRAPITATPVPHNLNTDSLFRHCPQRHSTAVWRLGLIVAKIRK